MPCPQDDLRHSTQSIRGLGATSLRMLIPALGIRDRELHTATGDCIDARAVHMAWFLSGQVATGEQEAARGTDDEGDSESDFEDEYHGAPLRLR